MIKRVHEKASEFTIFHLVCEDLTSVGAPMDSVRASEIYSKLFSTKAKAMTDASADNRRCKGEPIVWKRESSRSWPSQDLRSHMYVITEEKVE